MAGTPDERRTVCVVFAQAAGLADLPDAERAACADELFTLLRAVVERHGGTLDKIIGDVLMAVWGAPVAHEDDPLRATRAALEMKREASDWAAARRPGVDLRAGVNRGEVLYGAVGGDRATVMGDAVNVAQRLLMEAPSGATLLSESVERLVRREIVCRPLGALKVKGREEPVPAFEAVAGDRERTEVRIAPAIAGPFLGRDAELEALTGSDGAPVFVVGDAGVGKSRLLAEARRRLRVRRPGLRVLLGRAHDGVRLPLNPFAEMVRSEAGLAGADARDAARLAEKLAADLVELGGDTVERENTAHLILLSIGYPAPGARVVQIAPERLVAETHDAWARWFRARSSEAQVLACVEDLHWADDATRALLEALASALPADRVRLVATARPEAAAPRGFRRLELAELPEDAALAIAQRGLGGELSPALKAFVVEKTGANPYYVEELCRYLRENALVAGRPLALGADAARVPDGLLGLLVARLDALPPGAREILKAASVVGRTFWRHFVARLAGGEVEEGLMQARRREMVFPQGASSLPGDDQFVFKHALLRDSAYSLLTKKERSRLHAASADLLEERAPEAGRRIRAMAARHRESAGQIERAAALYLEAAQEANRSAAFAEAIDLARAGQKSGAGSRARIVAAAALFGLARYPEALAEAEAAAAAPESGPQERFDARLRMARVHGTIGAASVSLACAREALAAAPTEEAEAEAKQLLAEALVRTGETEEADAMARAALAASAGTSLRGSALRVLGVVHLRRGDFDAALDRFREALEAGRGSGNRQLCAACLAQMGTVHNARQEGAAALARFGESLALLREVGDRAGVAANLNSIGNVHLETGSLAEALEAYGQALALRREIRERPGEAASLGSIGKVRLVQGRVDEAIASFETALRIFDEVGQPYGAAITHENIGVALHRKRENRAALESHERALEIHRRIGDRAGIARTLSNMGCVYGDEGDEEKARAAAEEAMAVRRAIGDREGISDSLTTLGLIEAGKGNFDDALRHFEEALAVDRDIGYRAGIAICLLNVACMRQAQGRFREAAAGYEESRAISAALGDAGGAAEALLAKSHSLRDLGDSRAALLEAEAALAIDSDAGLRAAATLAVALLRFDTGDAETGRRRAEEAAAHCAGLDASRLPSEAVSCLAELCAKAGIAAPRILEDARSLLDKPGHRRDRAFLDLATARLIAATDPAECRRRAEAALAAARDTRHPAVEAGALALLARLDASAGRADDARGRMQEARAAAESPALPFPDRVRLLEDIASAHSALGDLAGAAVARLEAERLGRDGWFSDGRS